MAQNVNWVLQSLRFTFNNDQDKKLCEVPAGSYRLGLTCAVWFEGPGPSTPAGDGAITRVCTDVRHLLTPDVGPIVGGPV